MAPDGLSWFPLPRRDAARPRARAAGRARTRASRTSAPPSSTAGSTTRATGRAAAIELETALSRADACRDGFVWIGLHDPSPEVVEAVGKRFELHPLAVEDAVHAHQRPKLEVLGDTLFLVIKTARHVDSSEPVEIGEVMIFVGPRFVVTVRHGEGSPLHDVRLDLEAHPDLLGIGPSSALYAVVDRIVDDYAGVIERLALEVDAVEAEVFGGRRVQPDRADLQAQARGARVQARGRAAGRARCSAWPPSRPACRSTRAPPTTSATSTTTSSATSSRSRPSTSC